MVNGKISQRHAGSLFPFHFWLKQKFCLGKSPIEVKMGLAEMASCGHQPKLIVLVPRFHWSVFSWEEPLSPSRGCQAAIQTCTSCWHSSHMQVSEWMSERVSGKQHACRNLVMKILCGVQRGKATIWNMATWSTWAQFQMARCVSIQYMLMQQDYCAVH